MKRWAIGFFACYPLLPVAFGCGLGLLDHKAYSIFAIVYYALLLASLWNLRRLGGWASRWYSLAFAVTCIHLAGVGGLMLTRTSDLTDWHSQDLFLGMILLSIFGVYVAATWAGAALAFRLRRPLEGALQLLAPMLLFLGTAWDLGVPALLLAFGGQAIHALILSLRLVKRVENEEFDIGLSPAGET